MRNMRAGESTGGAVSGEKSSKHRAECDEGTMTFQRSRGFNSLGRSKDPNLENTALREDAVCFGALGRMLERLTGFDNALASALRGFMLDGERNLGLGREVWGMTRMTSGDSEGIRENTTCSG